MSMKTVEEALKGFENMPMPIQAVWVSRRLFISQHDAMRILQGKIKLSDVRKEAS